MRLSETQACKCYIMERLTRDHETPESRATPEDIWIDVVAWMDMKEDDYGIQVDASHGAIVRAWQCHRN